MIFAMQPTRASELIFLFKSSCLRMKRLGVNLFLSRIVRMHFSDELKKAETIAESVSELWTEDSAAEKILQAGKVENLRVACRRINGLEIEAGEVFSFWKHVGWPGKLRGFVKGRELRQGCIIPNTGGGLCQLSNALYDAALKAGFEIVERHAHSQVIKGSLAEINRDATVFWNYVDLRFRSPRRFRIEAVLTEGELIVKYKSSAEIQVDAVAEVRKKADVIGSCASCGMYDCHKNAEKEPAVQLKKTAYLVDEYSAEVQNYILKTRSERDVIGVPLDGKRFNKANYAWNLSGFADVKTLTVRTLLRAFKSRRLATQGAARQKFMLEADRELAKGYASLLKWDVTHIVCAEKFLPYLKENGYLGGRSYDVIMNRYPLKVLQAKLDLAFEKHPMSPTLGDFRIDQEMADAEAKALKNARAVITAHKDIASLFGTKAVLLEWKVKLVSQAPRVGKKIAFIGPSLGRKGAYEVREAFNTLGLPLVVFGRSLEGEDFWQGVDVEFRRFDENWLEQIGLIIQPAYVEHNPRKLLEAAVCGVKILASKECGIACATEIAIDAESIVKEVLLYQAAPQIVAVAPFGQNVL